MMGDVADDAGQGGDIDRVFKALADPTRRFLLDLLFARDGRTLTELESELEMTRFGVMKHLRVLEEAGVAITPGLDFGSNRPERHVRFAYTRSLEDLEEGVERIARMLGGGDAPRSY